MRLQLWQLLQWPLCPWLLHRRLLVPYDARCCLSVGAGLIWPARVMRSYRRCAAWPLLLGWETPCGWNMRIGCSFASQAQQAMLLHRMPQNCAGRI